MSKNISVIEQLSPVTAQPTYHVNRRIAANLIETGRCVWVVAGRVLRKTVKHSQLTDDRKITMGQPLALRGLSAQVGAGLAEATRSNQDRFWAMPMLDEVTSHPRMPSKTRWNMGKSNRRRRSR